MEEPFFFHSDTLRLNGLIHQGNKERGVVVTHPHPLYGGDMYSLVVESVIQAYTRKGFTTLRFNFRGVGQSQGEYDNGIGEQNDVRSAMAYLHELGVQTVDLVGYSFGSWVNAKLAEGEKLFANLILVSPPVALINFEPVVSIPCLKLVVTGSRDEIAPSEVIHKYLGTWNPNARFEIIEGADHFYFGFFGELEGVLSMYL